MNNRLLFIVCIASVITKSIAAEELQIGTAAPTSIVGVFATGELHRQHGSACPVLLERNSPKIAIYSRSLNDVTLELATAVDGIVASKPALKWSYLFVSHENLPPPSKEHWDKSFASLKQTASDRQLNFISFGLLPSYPDDGAIMRAKKRTGFLSTSDLVVMVIKPDETKKRGVITYVKSMRAAETTAEQVESVINEIKQAVKTE